MLHLLHFNTYYRAIKYDILHFVVYTGISLELSLKEILLRIGDFTYSSGTTASEAFDRRRVAY